MAAYLAGHPQVGMCARKETHYFADDLRRRLAVKRGQRPPTRSEYMQLFADVQAVPRRGEASVWYLYSKAASGAIRRFCRDAQIIAMLRNPIDMLHSLHSEFVYQGLEPVGDFQSALALDPEREAHGPPRGFPPSSYRSAVHYAEQLARYVETFGRDRVHIILYDDLSVDPEGTFRQTCEFLGVEPNVQLDFEVVNPNKRVRSRVVRDLLRRPPESLRPALHAVTSVGVRRRVAAAVRKANRAFVERDPVPERVTETLRPLVEEEVENLRDQVGVDARRWLSKGALAAS